MLNILAATDYSNYAKCVRMYLQQMEELPEKYPWLHTQFMNELYTVTRSDQNRISILTYLAIKQTLMRAQD